MTTIPTPPQVLTEAEVEGWREFLRLSGDGGYLSHQLAHHRRVLATIDHLRAQLAEAQAGMAVLVDTVKAIAPDHWLDDDTMEHMPGIAQARCVLANLPAAARAYAEEVERLRAAARWQPIETAPKDGTIIWVWAHASRMAAFVKWNAEGTSWVDEYGIIGCERAHHLEATGIWETDGGWFQPDEITHWRPLPAPPLHAAAAPKPPAR